MKDAIKRKLSMLLLLLQPQNLPFTIALGLLFGFACLELITMLFGSSLFSMVDDLLPDLDADADMDVDTDVDGMDGGSSFLQATLGWLMLGKAPFLIILSIFLTAFGLTGLVLQFAWQSINGNLLAGWLASIPALMIALPVMRHSVSVVARVMPKEESSIVSQTSFIGKIGIIVMGTARKGSPTQARFQDEFKQTHYVLVEPENEGESFTQGDEVVLVEHLHGEVFIAMRFQL